MEKIKSLLKNKAFLIALTGVISLSILAAGTYAWFTTTGAADNGDAIISAATLGVELAYNTDDTELFLLPGETEEGSVTAILSNTGNREIVAKINLYNNDGDGDPMMVLADGTPIDLTAIFDANEYFTDIPHATEDTYEDNLILPSTTSEYFILDGYIYVSLLAGATGTDAVSVKLTYGIAGKDYGQDILQGATIRLANGDGVVQAVQGTEDAVRSVFGNDVADFFF